MTRILTENSSGANCCPIQPENINWEGDFLKTFESAPTAIAVRALGKLALQNGGWAPFTKKEICDFTGTDFLFCGLSGGDISAVDKLIVRGRKDEKYCYTHEFIQQCHSSNPRT